MVSYGFYCNYYDQSTAYYVVYVENLRGGPPHQNIAKFFAVLRAHFLLILTDFQHILHNKQYFDHNNCNEYHRSPN